MINLKIFAQYNNSILDWIVTNMNRFIYQIQIFQIVELSFIEDIPVNSQDEFILGPG